MNSGLHNGGLVLKQYYEVTMKILSVFIMIGLSVYYISCENKNDDGERLNNLLFPDLEIPQSVDCGKVILAGGIDSSYPIMDSYTVNHAEFDEDTLNIEVSYGGGCKEHGFCLIAWSYFLESNPVQANLLLSHNSNEDNCEAWVTSELSIDMTPLKQEYYNQYGTKSDSIIVRILISSGEELNLMYKFN